MTQEARDTVFGRRLFLAGVLLIAGLLVQTVTLGWNHPLAFTLFLGPGILLVAGGLAVFLWAVFQQSQVGWDRLGGKRVFGAERRQP